MSIAGFLPEWTACLIQIPRRKELMHFPATRPDPAIAETHKDKPDLLSP